MDIPPTQNINPISSDEPEKSDSSNEIKPAVYTSAKKEKFILKKIVIGIITLSLMAVLVEGIYYFINKTKADSIGSSNTKAISPTGTAQAQPIPVTTSQFINLGKMNRLAQYIQQIQDKGEFVDVAMTNIINSGFVEEIGVDEVTEDGIPYYFKITLKSRLNNLHTYRFTKAEMETARVILLIEREAVDSNLASIVKDDHIVLDISSNLKDNSPNKILIRVIR